MRNLICLLAMAGSVFLTSCGSSAGNQNDEEVSPVQLEAAAWAEMMEVHDAVMPKMAEMNRVSRELKAVGEELSDKTKQERVNKAVKELEAASEGMMAWMSELKNLETLRKEKAHDEIMAYLEGETAVISNVKAQMLRSLEQGSALLNELEAENTAE